MTQDILGRFLDKDNKIKLWPSKPSHKEIVLSYLAAKFQKDIIYTENGVNDILNQWHTFTDWPLLGRELVDRGYMVRDTGGYEYKVVAKV